MNWQFVREFSVDPGMMDSLPKEQLQAIGRKNPYALSALESVTSAEIRAVIERI